MMNKSIQILSNMQINLSSNSYRILNSIQYYRTQMYFFE